MKYGAKTTHVLRKRTFRLLIVFGLQSMRPEHFSVAIERDWVYVPRKTHYYATLTEN